MDLTVGLNEWKKAKELFVQLSQAFNPKTLNQKPILALGEGEGPIMLSASPISEEILRKIFKRRPSTEQFSHTVRLLPTLQSAQKQMNLWIEMLPDESGKTSKNSFFYKLESPVKQRVDPSLKAKSERENIHVQSQHKSIGSEEFSQKANRFLIEVRLAIQSLSTSSYLSNPQPGPLRSALTKLKPLVDEMIDSLSKPGHPADVEKQEETSLSRCPSIFTKSENGQEDRSRLISSSKLNESLQFNVKSIVSHHSPRDLKNEDLMALAREPSRQEVRIEEERPPSIPKPKQFAETSTEKKQFFGSVVSPNLQNAEKSESQKMKNKPVVMDQKKTEVDEGNSRIKIVPNPKINPNVPIGNQADLDAKQFSSSFFFLAAKSEQEPSFQDRPSPPIALPITAATNQILQGAPKRKKRRRYFFKNDELEDDSKD